MNAEVLLAFDFGARWIGVAVGNTVSGEARALARLATDPIARRFAAIGRLMDEWAPQRLVVGLPLDQTGGRQPATERAERFARQLAGRFGRPVELVDERYSSLAAAEISGRNRPDDAEAAAVILRQYLAAAAGQGARDDR